MPSRPWFPFFPSDWRGDAKLRTCSPLARLLWLEMMCLMHDGSPYGHLNVSPAQLAQLAGIPKAATLRLLDELEVAGVFSRRADGTIYSRRMVRDDEVRQRRAAGGAESLKNPHVPRPKDILEGHPEGRPQIPDTRYQRSQEDKNPPTGRGRTTDTFREETP